MLEIWNEFIELIIALFIIAIILDDLYNFYLVLFHRSFVWIAAEFEIDEKNTY